MQHSAKAIAQVPPFMARMQPVTLPSGAIIIRDEYNGSQDTFEKMVEVLEHAQAERLVLIISDVTDRKGNPKKRQSDIGRVAADFAQMAIFCGDHGHHAQKAAIRAGMDPEHCHHVMGLRATSELMKKHLRSGDLVFLKGRATDHLSRLVFAQYGEFACWSESCRYTITCDTCVELKAKFDLQKMV
jgi:UDP-N-acetylmuramoyl-tripeptide--D-alanyl-D-alanine ligase